MVFPGFPFLELGNYGSLLHILYISMYGVPPQARVVARSLVVVNVAITAIPTLAQLFTKGSVPIPYGPSGRSPGLP